ncbi:protein of unknown function [Caldanaerovirga acetigignens]|uniref:LarA-like N-terminal domain-containing protein n=1 Tax=Caldanaerovirga acetigignens TaxID=447595 RepID=A0A1M7HAT2_9FIRM|nr:lactate racemase domain-containing protein [Caldanaerovirga acetigignens]SHM25287.1 protein of unknown function [Caldanaerovirga acetigignens]
MDKYGLKIDFEPIINLVDDVIIPKMYKIRQHFETPRLTDPIKKLHKELLRKSDQLKSLRDKRVCIAVGSRGINNISIYVRELVKLVTEYGGKPFIIPAMGSHGGATPEGQRKVLEELGITDDEVGAPVISNLDVEYLGDTEEGIPVYTSLDALNSDAVILINRVKPHTSFRGDIESGLIKMAVIGLGKQKGADLCHKMGFYRFADRLKSMARMVLSKVPVAFGVALLENAYDETADIKVLLPQEFFEEEPKLLEKAKSWMPRLPVDNIDVLIVDEIGKDISGDGMDPNITGRFASEFVKGDKNVNRIVVLRLTERTKGNANGIGVADVTTLKVLGESDLTKGYINSITAAIPPTVRIPMVMPNDYYAIKAAIKTANNLDYSGEKTRIVRIKNTLQLEYLYISKALISEIRDNSDIEIVEGPITFKFDINGNLLTWW